MSKRRLLWPPRRKRHNQISQQILIRYVFSVLGMIGGLVLLFFLGSFLATTLEFLTALVMKRIFGEIWWDYHEKPFNYRGIICLESSIAWGFYTLFLFMFLQNIVAAFVAMIPVRAGRAIGNLILIGYIMDFSATIYRQKKENLQESTDEEQIQQIEQAKDKMKDNFLT